MTSIARRAAIGLRATLLSAGLIATAACTASPRYPIEEGGTPGDGGLHMTARPQYPLDERDAARSRRDEANQGAVARSADVAHPRPPPPEADDAPRPAPSSSVDSTDLPPAAPPPPPRTDLKAELRADLHADLTGFHALTLDGEPEGVSTAEVGDGFWLAAYRHHRRHVHEAQKPKDEETAKAEPLARHGRHRHGSAKVAEKADSDSSQGSGQASGKSADAAPDTPFQTTVRSGEKLSDVAERVHASRQSLMNLNSLKRSARVRAGTVLKVPYRYSYQVGKGDTLYGISHRFNQDTDTLAKLNGMRHAAALQPGQTIVLPVTAEDLGSRDHAKGSAPEPEAAPERLAEAELKKRERTAARHGSRHERTPATNSDASSVADVSPTFAAPVSRRERRLERRRELAEAAQVAKASRAARGRAYAAPATGLTSSALTSSALTSSALTSSALTSAALAPPLAASPRIPSSAVAETSDGAATQRPYPVPAADAGAPSSSSTLALAPPAPTGSEISSSPSPASTAPLTSPWTRPATTAATTSPGIVRPSVSRPIGAASAATPAASAPAYVPGRLASLNPPTYAGPSLGRTRPTVPTMSSGAFSNSDVASAGQGRFVWPLRGAILQPFGDRGPGQRNDGVDIAAEAGAGVHAAAGGEVVYAGSSIPGFGNLVLVKHPGGWVTAYAHLDRIEVRMRDPVSQGEEIGQAGQTGAVTRPQLHFEVRYAPDATEKARPVDPVLVLPDAG